MDEKIQICDLTRRFGDIVAVDSLNLSVKKGEVLGFLGPNGAGKTTTMRVLAGFLSPSAGSAHVCGFDVTKDPIAVKSRIGYMPEGAPSYNDMTPPDFFNFIAEIRGLKGKNKARCVAQAIEYTNLYDVLDQPIETLSKGYTRRVGLAQAVLHDPEVLILDEPTEGLDPNQKFEVRTLIKNIASEKVIVISTHILEEVNAVCSRAAIIDKGRLVADGTPEDLQAQSARHNMVIVDIDAQHAQTLAQGLEAIEAIAKTTTLPAQLHDNAVRLEIVPHNQAAVAPVVLKLLDSKNIQARQIFVEKGHLDDVFRKLTTQQSAHTARTGEPQ